MTQRRLFPAVSFLSPFMRDELEGERVGVKLTPSRCGERYGWGWDRTVVANFCVYTCATVDGRECDCALFLVRCQRESNINAGMPVVSGFKK